MSTTGNSPARESYSYHREFHRQTWKATLRRKLAGSIPQGLRQRLRLRRRLELIREFALDGLDLLLRRKKELILPRHLNFVGHGDFEATGDEFLKYFVDLGGLKPHERVIEIGCGVGRMARPLTRFLGFGEYHGIDIVPKAIRWCTRNISGGYPQFHFHLANIHNLAYNPRGHLLSIDYRFPFGPGTFDFAFLTSVFSHMLTADVQHYLDETARCLRPGGRCLITFFLLNAESRRLIGDNASALSFQFRREGCYVNDDLVPECGRSHFLSYQDVLIGHKRG